MSGAEQPDAPGNTFERHWDGNEATALSLVEAAEDTAFLVTRTAH
jgi:hypothetical protein